MNRFASSVIPLLFAACAPSNVASGAGGAASPAAPSSGAPASATDATNASTTATDGDAPPFRTEGDGRPTTEAERRAAVRWIHSLEEDPEQADHEKIRARLMSWLLAVPDVTVVICTDLLGPVAARKGPFDPPVIGQLMFADAAFAIEHPDRADDRAARATAGVDAAVRVYKQLLKRHAEARIPLMDDLSARRDRGELDKWVSKGLTDCVRGH